MTPQAQIMAFYSQVNAWPETLQNTFNFLQFASLNMDILAIPCIVATTYFTLFLLKVDTYNFLIYHMQLLFPFVLAIFFLAANILMRIIMSRRAASRRRRGLEFQNLLVRISFFLLRVICGSLCRNIWSYQVFRRTFAAASINVFVYFMTLFYPLITIAALMFFKCTEQVREAS